MARPTVFASWAWTLGLVACGPSSLELGLPSAPGMSSGLLGLRGSAAGGAFEELYGIDVADLAGLDRVRPLEAGTEAPPVTLEILLFACELDALGLDVGPVALSPQLGVEPPPTNCRFEARLDQEIELVKWNRSTAVSAAVLSLRYSSREPTCPRDETLHQCPES